MRVAETRRDNAARAADPAAGAPRRGSTASSRRSRRRSTDPIVEVEEQLAQESADLAGQARGARRRLQRAVRGAAGAPAYSGRCVAAARASGWPTSKPRAAGACRAAGEDRPRRRHRWVARRARSDAVAPPLAARSTSSAAGRTRWKPCCASASSGIELARLDDARRLDRPATRRCRAAWPHFRRRSAPARAGGAADALLAKVQLQARRGRPPARRRARRRPLPPRPGLGAGRARGARRGRVVRHARRAPRHRAGRRRSSRPTTNCTACSRGSASSRSSRSRSRSARSRARRAARVQRDAVDADLADDAADLSRRRACRRLAAAPRARPRARARAAEAGGRGRAAAARADRRRRRADLDASEARGRRPSTTRIAAEIADLQSRCTTSMALRESAPARPQRSRGRAGARPRAAARRRTRERRKPASRSAAAATAWRSSSGAARRLAAQDQQQRTLLAQLTSERAAIDWTPVEASLQRQLGRARRRRSRRWPRRATASRRWARAARRRGVAARGRAEARTRAREDPGHAAQGAGGGARRAAVHRAARRGARRPRALPEALKAWGSARTLARRRSSDCSGHRRARRGQPGGARRARAGAGAQGLPRRAGGRPDRGDDHARDRDPPDRPRVARAACSRRSTTVNENFAQLFPALFGGGKARLVLTGEEILDSGVQVVAQPPGKRNTSIHLLSGGEKALTAISLVFALFQLNPAPFCLLDEVDAPLDDPNTERFCTMVREMSAQYPVPVHLAQQDHDGDGEPAGRHHDARAGRLARRRGRHRRGAVAGRDMPRDACCR